MKERGIGEIIVDANKRGRGEMVEETNERETEERFTTRRSERQVRDRRGQRCKCERETNNANKREIG